MAFNLAGRVALVTGASKGLGRGIADALGAAGASVAWNYWNDRSAAERAFAEFEGRGGRGLLARADVTDERGVGRLVAEVTARLGPIDILVVNATPAQPMQPLEEYDWALFQRMLDFFVKSPFLLCRALLPSMKARRFGRIIQITTEAFREAKAPFTAYVAAKGGQIGFSRSLAHELAPAGITVNMVSPNWIPTERHADDPAAVKEAYLREIPVGRWGTPQDVAAAVVYLASNEAGFVTGQTISVNGGRMAS